MASETAVNSYIYWITCVCPKGININSFHFLFTKYTIENTIGEKLILIVADQIWVLLRIHQAFLNITWKKLLDGCSVVLGRIYSLSILINAQWD